MSDFIEIKFKGERKGTFANPMQFPFKVGDCAVVEVEKGEDFGRVNNLFPNLDLPENPEEIKLNILRKPHESDYLRHKQNQINEIKALEICRKKVEKHGLNMKLVDCEYQLDGGKVTFYFTAEKRVDFRELVKDLAAEYRTRIELRQMGVRDEARRIGGFGVCGRKLCCASWIKEFQPITTQAAKEQNLPLNPNKLAGVCGRLKCCLMFELEFYNWAITTFPQLAKDIITEKGRGVIERIDIFKESVLVRYQGGEHETLSLAAVKKDIYKCQNDCGLTHGNMEELQANAN